MSKTITISMSENDIKNIDTYCTMHELTRSKFMVQASLEKVQQEFIANYFGMLCDHLSKTGNLDGIVDKNDLNAILALQKAGYLNSGK